MSKPTFINGEQELINEIIEKVIACNLKEAITYGEDVPAISFNEWTRENRSKLGQIFVDCGCTKAVFLHRNLENWVIKVPFLFTPEYAPGVKHYTNYCAAEVEVYEQAKAQHLNEYLAPIYHYATIDGVPFYIQQRVNLDEGLNEDLFFNYCAKSVDRAEYEDEDDYYDAISCDVDYMDDEERLCAIFGGFCFVESLIAFFENSSLRFPPQ